MRDGIAAGITIPRVIVERSLTQLEALARRARSHRAERVVEADDEVSRARSTQRARQRSKPNTGSSSLSRSFPRCAGSPRSCATSTCRARAPPTASPRCRAGDAMYRFAVRSETTTDMTPEEIHELGLKEVARIQAPACRKRAGGPGFNGPMASCSSGSRANPANYPFATGEEVIEYLYRIHARIVPAAAAALRTHFRRRASRSG